MEPVWLLKLLFQRQNGRRLPSWWCSKKCTFPWLARKRFADEWVWKMSRRGNGHLQLIIQISTRFYVRASPWWNSLNAVKARQKSAATSPSFTILCVLQWRTMGVQVLQKDFLGGDMHGKEWRKFDKTEIWWFWWEKGVMRRRGRKKGWKMGDIHCFRLQWQVQDG